MYIIHKPRLSTFRIREEIEPSLYNEAKIANSQCFGIEVQVKSKFRGEVGNGLAPNASYRYEVVDRRIRKLLVRAHELDIKPNIWERYPKLVISCLSLDGSSNFLPP